MLLVLLVFVLLLVGEDILDEAADDVDGEDIDDGDDTEEDGDGQEDVDGRDDVEKSGDVISGPPPAPLLPLLPLLLLSLLVTKFGRLGGGVKQWLLLPPPPITDGESLLLL